MQKGVKESVDEIVAVRDSTVDAIADELRNILLRYV